MTIFYRKYRNYEDYLTLMRANLDWLGNFIEKPVEDLSYTPEVLIEEAHKLVEMSLIVRAI